MRSNLLGRRILFAPALGLAVVVAAAACSSSSSSSASSPSSTSAPQTSPSAPASPATGSSPSAGGSATIAAITANWESFFSGQTPATKKISLLENGQTFASTINSQAGSSLASSASAKVTKVQVNSPTSATVTYNIIIGGTPALSGQTGQAVNQDGTWKVGDTSFCKLLTLENGGKAPSVCSSAG